MVMLPVLFSPIGAYAVISKAIVLVVSLGLLHSLFIIPVLLTALPESILRCCFKR
ncbi:unnamed protein product [Gongylonema pulchrum]|uniref:SSD domain-containing protein n=1 Tax=Gongylonema pulchrum TaxID=637853 RepID=A0A3P6QTB7_9BILA|nr:unnamed protein product [Gongylonema pulchrum]